MMILVAGLPGSGKSYLAERLAERLDAVYLSSDRVRKSMNALGKYSSEDKMAVYEEMLKMAAGALALQKTVVADATFYKSELRRNFKDLARKWHSRARVILVSAGDSLVRERLGKQRADSEASYDVHLKIKDQFETIVEPHMELESTNDNIGPMLEQAIRYIYYTHDG